MTTEEALALLELDWPRSNKLSCPNVSDSNPSLHLYPEDRGFYCFTCNTGGDGLDLLSHFTGQPLSELISEHGIKLGPRGRSRWQQVADLKKRAALAGEHFQKALWPIWGKTGCLPWVAQIEDRKDYLFDDLARIDEDMAPFQLHSRVRELERFYQAELQRHQESCFAAVSSASDGSLQRQGLRGAVRPARRPSGGSVRVTVPQPDGDVRLA